MDMDYTINGMLVEVTDEAQKVKQEASEKERLTVYAEKLTGQKSE